MLEGIQVSWSQDKEALWNMYRYMMNSKAQAQARRPTLRDQGWILG